MKISGLSNQWKTRDELFEAFSIDAEGDPLCNERSRVIREFLLHLETLDGPELWIGTSHHYLNFCRRDVEHQFDYIPTFVSLEAYDIQREPSVCGYRIGFSLTGAQWEYIDIKKMSEAGELIGWLMRNSIP